MVAAREEVTKDNNYQWFALASFPGFPQLVPGGKPGNEGRFVPCLVVLCH